ncbi:hypothetical protein I302_100754 [Kwoniella bestiolae CBS 10118]|uniref:HTH APSES-type domain-containing protein n=1 Tax=Kwoniella bestiolae CBS 10118 TaxID=1296100 RepID=A0A1B9G613_9TREE|nr:hypothetical protein I302_04127 [Kwoniella bestiolae CBS 10118]OCF26442.1 hypothetical protein I302_04127 [Kwoniella bestiolae CBS 10118]
MEASSSTTHNQPPATPSHSSLLPSLSPSGAIEQTPAPLHTLPSHLHSQQPPPPQPRLGPSQQQQNNMQPPPSVPSSSNGQQHLTPAQQLQQQHQNVFGNVMGTVPGQGPNNSNQTGGTAQAKVYASVYSGIPVFEAMIRGISVMRRTSDSWVNATQILKVAGIHKSARTKILEKEIHPGVHEKVQGGYGKYQGTWIPFERGQELAAQYGVTAYLAPVFDFVPSPTAIAALPVIRTGTPDRAGQKTPSSSMAGYTPSLMSGNRGSAQGNGRVISPFPHGHAHPHAQAGQLPPPPPPQFTPSNGDQNQMMGMPMGYPNQQQMMYYPAPPQQHMYPGQGDNKRGIAMAMTPSLSGDGHHNPSLGPAANIDLGLPPSGAEMYIDQYGHPHPTPSYQPMNYTTDTDMGPPPAKRQKSEDGAYLNGSMEEQQHEPPQQEAEGEDIDDGASDSSDDLRDSQPLPSSMRLSNKPIRPRPNSNTSKTRSRLLSLFSTTSVDAGDDEVNVRQVFGLGADELPDTFDIDMVIDNQGHTALHWACALSKLSIIKQLIELGSDIHRGNFAGETPLIRSVLTTNQFESGQFYQLLELLSPSIKTLDHSYRSVIHHISMVAGVKGRAASARSYMANVLEWVAREQQQQQITHSMNGDHLNGSSGNDTISLKTLIDIQDVHGDTAINIAARVGNKGLVNLLLDAGADKGKANKLGLKPSDFGLDIESLKVSPAEAIVSSLKSEVPKPERKSRDVQKNISAIFETISSTFSTEMVNKQTKLNATEQSVRVATKALADKRQQLHRAQVKVGELELLNQRIESLKQFLSSTPSEQAEDWTGRKLLAGENELPPSFQQITSDSSGGVEEVKNETEEGEDDEIKLPERTDSSENNNSDNLIKLRRINIWQDRVLALLDDKIRNLENQNFEKNYKYRKLISLSTKVPVEKVDGMIDGLVTAIESDGQSIDLSKISEFMSRMKEQV